MFEKLQGVWSGQGELWLDPLGNEVATSEVTASGDGESFAYSWSHDGASQSGSFVTDGVGVRWTDTFHQADGADCAILPDPTGALVIQHQYLAPGWRWRTGFYERPDGTLVVQMTNIAPWGEEGRAVRMTLSRL